MLDVLYNIRLFRAVNRLLTPLVKEEGSLTHVFNSLHDSYFVLDLLIKHVVLYKLAFLDLLCHVQLPREFRAHFIYRGESTLANLTNRIVLVRTIPRPGRGGRPEDVHLLEPDSVRTILQGL